MHRFSIFSLVCLIGIGSWQTSLIASPQSNDNGQQRDGSDLSESARTNGPPQTLRFQFQESDWEEVIPWFAEQAGFSLQPISDWPEGTFYLKDDSEYTVMQALDQLNHALRMRDPPFTLIRNRNMLILTQVDDANFPNELIETVAPSELDERGKYETISCIFDLGELDVEAMYDELKPMISSSNKDYFAVFPAANQIRVRETGGTLRDIRDLIETSSRRMIGDNQDLKVYRLKHVDAETFMLIARGLLGMDPGRDFTSDGSLIISREPLGDRLFVRGTPKMQRRFAETAAVIDVPPEEVGDVQVVKQFFKNYSIMVDPKLGHDLLETVLEGSGARMQQDENTGNIMVLGTAEDHQAVEAALAAVSGEYGEAFEIIKIESGDATEIMLAIQSLLRQTTTVAEGAAAKGPVVMANSLLNQILVRGTPKDVGEVSRMVKQLDANSVPYESGPRTGTRIINMGEQELEDLTPMMKDLLGASNRKNSLNIVMPEHRKDVKSRLRGVPERAPTLDEIWDMGPAGTLPARRANPASDEKNEQSDKRKPDSRRKSEGASWRLNKSRPLNRSWAEGLAMIGAVSGNYSLMQTSLIVAPTVAVQDEDSQAGQTSDENKKKKDGEYQSAPQFQSVPGAPIEVRVTDYGMVLESEDLDALDDLERSIREQLGAESEAQLPTFFFLQYRKAENLKSFLEQYFGLADSGGGGDAGGGLMGGMMNNMLGGGAGDLLGGLLGGGGGLGGTGGAGTLEGDVRFGIDVPFNAIYIAGATGFDLDQISELIDILDQPNAPHQVDMIGETRTIDILYRDPEEVKLLIEEQIPDYIESGKSEGGGQQNNEMAQMTKMLQQLQGGRGGGSENADQEKPKARLGVDLTTSRLLVTGPEFIFQKIFKIVMELDKKELSDPLNMQIIPRPGNIDALKGILQQMYPGKIEFVESEEGETTGAEKSDSSNGGANNSAAQAQQQQVNQAREAIQNAIRQRQQQQGGGGGGRGGGGGGRGGGGGGRGGGGGGGGRGG